MRTIFTLAVALDLVVWAAMVLSYVLGLRLSDVFGLDVVKNLFIGKGGRRGDLKVRIEAHKGDGGGSGFSRWVQDASGCPCEFRSAACNADGAQFCGQWAQGTTESGRWCAACLLLHLLHSMGYDLAELAARPEPEDGECDECDDREENGEPLFRSVKRQFFSFERQNGSRAAAQESYLSEMLPYESYNPLLHRILIKANERRRKAGLAIWSVTEFHWHMFRHGNVMMALVFKEPEHEILRKLRMVPETLESYRQHVVSAYSAVLSEQVDPEVQASADRTEAQVLAEATMAALGPSALTPGDIRDAILRMCNGLHMAVRGLKAVKKGFRQVIVCGAAAQALLPPALVKPLLAALGTTDDGRAPSAGDGSVVTMSRLVHADELQTAARAPIHDWAWVEEGTERIDAASEAEGTTTVAMSVQELKERWHEVRAELDTDPEVAEVFGCDGGGGGGAAGSSLEALEEEIGEVGFDPDFLEGISEDEADP